MMSWTSIGSSANLWKVVGATASSVLIDLLSTEGKTDSEPQGREERVIE
jgi:hypothetical protein